MVRSKQDYFYKNKQATTSLTLSMAIGATVAGGPFAKDATVEGWLAVGTLGTVAYCQAAEQQCTEEEGKLPVTLCHLRCRWY